MCLVVREGAILCSRWPQDTDVDATNRTLQQKPCKPLSNYV